nr:hypothetical protein [Enterovibrio nigricans]
MKNKRTFPQLNTVEEREADAFASQIMNVEALHNTPSTSRAATAPKGYTSQHSPLNQGGSPLPKGVAFFSNIESMKTSATSDFIKGKNPIC